MNPPGNSLAFFESTKVSFVYIKELYLFVLSKKYAFTLVGSSFRKKIEVLDMEENENTPVLISSKPLSSEFAKAQKIALTSGDFTLGRSLKNSVCIPFLSISRNHCTFKKTSDNEWYVEDNSSLGIKINNERLGQGSKRKLEHEDLISLEPSDEFIYKFILPHDNLFEIPRKRMRLDKPIDSTIIDKFEASQKCEIQHIEDKIQNAKQMQTTSIILKKQLQEDMNRKIKQLENEFSVQIENLKGEKNEVEKQKASLIEERDAQLTNVKDEMEGKIAELMEQIEKHNETESELLNENGLLKDKLLKEREDFLAELNRESSSKQDMLDKLEAKIRDQEEVRLKERQELEDTLRRETEQLRLAKEKELKALEELKRQREIELQQELSHIKQNLAEQVELTEQQKVQAELVHKLQMEHMDKLKAEEKVKIEQFLKEREEIQKELTKAQIDVEKSKEEIQETLNEFGDLMESELQCSVCAELFVEATTLNCSHTFYSFIEKMVQSLTDEMKTKRQEMLRSRADYPDLLVRLPGLVSKINRTCK
ncbi:putative ring finger protein 8-like protein [Operophtera brumata]|uniref:Putative ring finger protein 8-like protein n=1 Tax=Operophtera brumata TaxID=104452 RepID=A0A0L7LTK6_OPEBR|nr:putative ring finger protein 8-like protein [Operophtera brumata]